MGGGPAPSAPPPMDLEAPKPSTSGAGAAGAAGAARGGAPATFLGRAIAFCTVAPVQSGSVGFWDAVLLVAGLQIGQIMLVMPRAMVLTGMAAGMAMAAAAVAAGGWTLYLLFALYLEFTARRRAARARDKAGAGDADADDGEPAAVATAPPPAAARGVVQYHDVVAALAGGWAGTAIQALTAVALLGAGVAQILACATNTYAAMGGDGRGGGGAALSKRTYALAWGGAMLAFTAVPSYRDTRVLNALALVGTTFTAWYVTVAAKPAAAAAAAAAGLARLPPPPLGPASAGAFFLGGTVMIGALSGHVICIEVFDALGGSPRFLGAYALAQVWVLTLTVMPAGVAAAAFGPALAKSDSVFGVMPPSAALSAAAWLMNAHQVVVFGLVLMPLYYYAERAVGLHGRSGAVGRLAGWRRGAARIGARMPISLLVWVLALAFPFYGAINALIMAISFPALSFFVPCALFNWVYGRRGPAGAAARAAAPLPPFFLPGAGLVTRRAAWGAALALNWVLAVGGLAFMGGAMYYSVGAVVTGVRADGVFARCWQCKAAVAGGAAGKG